MFRFLRLSAAALALAVLPLVPAAQAQDGVLIEDAYARVSSPTAQSGAVFLRIVNRSATDADRLIAAQSAVAERVELHTHREDTNGVMQMIEVEEGFAVEPGATRVLERGGDHVMLLGLNRSLADGDMVPLTLTFERQGEVTLEVPVDLKRSPAGGAMHGGQGMGHGAGHGSGHGHGTGHGMGHGKATN
jgi:copper(I)-binding protein